MRKKIIIGNWKMNGSLQEIRTLLQQLLHSFEVELAISSNFVAGQKKSLQFADLICAVLPPSIYLPMVCEHLQSSPILWGAQNVYPQNFGAYTGELSAPMLKDYFCKYVLVGHSERRRIFAENEKFIANKFHHVKEHDMIPILCVGETLEERKQGLTTQIIKQQLLAITKNIEISDIFNGSVIAYEPVWAIGTGKTASPEEVQEVHAFIREFVATFNKKEARQLPIIYGGSVTELNAEQIFAMADVDGGLIGGASLNAQQFVRILKCIN